MRNMHINTINKNTNNASIKPSILKIYIITDIHLRKGVDGNENLVDSGTKEGRTFYASHSKLRNFVDIANSEKPDLILYLGDFCDSPNDFEFFFNEINKITNTRKEFTIGNHDFDNMSYENLVQVFNLTEKEEVGKSKFNKSFAILKEDFSVRFLMLDVNFDLNENHQGTARGRINSSGLSWLESEINNSNENYIFICSHILPHLYDYPSNWVYFEESHAYELQNIINASGKKVYALGGHVHTPIIKEYKNLGNNFLGYGMPDCIETETGKFTVLTISKNNFNLFERELTYPYF